MAAPKAAEKDTQTTPQTPPAPTGSGSGMLSEEIKQAENVAARNDLPVLAGPFKVGNIGEVSVVARQYQERTVKYARFASGTSRPSMIPLAAVGVLAENLD